MPSYDPPGRGQRRSLRDQGVGDHGRQVQALGRLEDAVRDDDALAFTPHQEERAGQLAVQGHDARIGRHVGETRAQSLDLLDHRVAHAEVKKHEGEGRGRGPRRNGHPHAWCIASACRNACSARSDRPASAACSPMRSSSSARSAVVVRHGEGLVEERDRLLMRPERTRPVGRGAQGDPGLCLEGVRLAAGGGVGEGGEVVARRGRRPARRIPATRGSGPRPGACALRAALLSVL